MAQCTAPVRGHSSAVAQAACPACRYRSSYRSSYGSGYSSSCSSGGGTSYSGGSRSSGAGISRPHWSRSSSTVSYTPAQTMSLTPVREAIEREAATKPDLRDCFLCHAWDDRQGAAKELHDLLEAAGVKVWFSEKDLGLGVSMMRAIDKGLAASKIGLVLVTPALLKRLPKEGVADKELSTLLRTCRAEAKSRSLDSSGGRRASHANTPQHMSWQAPSIWCLTTASFKRSNTATPIAALTHWPMWPFAALRATGVTAPRIWLSLRWQCMNTLVKEPCAIPRKRTEYCVN
ncbi:hypothetical protein C8238_02000 [Paracidovorax avenae]|nr:hypothetical protein C8238_02000 [Paracidovorax avenae]